MLLVLGVVYVAGRKSALFLATEEPDRLLKLGGDITILMIVFVSLLGALTSTLTLLLGDARTEEEFLLSLPVRLADLAAVRLAEVMIRSLRLALVMGVWAITAGWGVWSVNPPGGWAASRLVLWSVAMLLAALSGASLAASCGILAGLLWGRIIPPARREVALIGMSLLLLSGGAVLIARWSSLLRGLRVTDDRAWATLFLIPLWILSRLNEGIVKGTAESLWLGGGLALLTGMLLWLAARMWAHLTRHDMEVMARPDQWMGGVQPRHQSRLSARIDGGPVVDRLLRLVPISLRAVLLRDLKQASRMPMLRLRLGMLTAALVGLVAAGFQLFWIQLLLYYAPSEIGRDMLLTTLEEEREDLFFIQVLTPGLETYLRFRALAGFVITSGAGLVLLAVATMASPALTVYEWATVIRVLLLGIASWLAVLSCITCAAVFAPDARALHRPLAVSPAQLPTMVIGALVAGACTGIDLCWLGPTEVANFTPLPLPPALCTVMAGILLAGVILTPLVLKKTARRFHILSVE